MFNATFNTITVISWRSVLLVEETGIPGENHRPAASHWQTLSQNVVSSTPSLRGIRGFELTTLVVIGTDCIGSCKPTYHSITTITASFWIGRFVFTSKRKFKQWWSTIRQILRSFLIFTLTKGVEFMFYFTRSSEHNIFLFFTMLNNEDTNTFGMTSLQSGRPTFN